MSGEVSTCPSPERLAVLDEAIEQHIDVCASCRAALAAAVAGESRAWTLGRYRIDGVLGAGGMGVVYRGWDPALARPVAVKVVRPGADDGELRTRLAAEARSLAKLSHPNVCHVYDVGTDGDEVWIGMELVEGATLRAWLASRPSREEVLRVLDGAGRGIAAAHARGLVHRDVKPENVLVEPGGRAVVTDFGLARAVEGSRMTSSSALSGTPAYMASELLEGAPADARSDQYAFAVMAHEALAGARPKPRGVPSAELPAQLRAVLAKALAEDPAERFPTVEALLAAIAPRRRRSWRGTAAIAGGAAVAAVAATLAITGIRGDGGAASAATSTTLPPPVAVTSANPPPNPSIAPSQTNPSPANPSPSQPNPSPTNPPPANTTTPPDPSIAPSPTNPSSSPTNPPPANPRIAAPAGGPPAPTSSNPPPVSNPPPASNPSNRPAPAPASPPNAKLPKPVVVAEKAPADPRAHVAGSKTDDIPGKMVDGRWLPHFGRMHTGAERSISLEAAEQRIVQRCDLFASARVPGAVFPLDVGKVVRGPADVIAIKNNSPRGLKLYEIRGKRGTYLLDANWGSAIAGVLDAKVGDTVALCPERTEDGFEFPGEWKGAGTVTFAAAYGKVGGPPALHGAQAVDAGPISTAAYKHEWPFGDRLIVYLDRIALTAGARAYNGWLYLQVDDGFALPAAKSYTGFAIVDRHTFEHVGERNVAVLHLAALQPHVFPPPKD